MSDGYLVRVEAPHFVAGLTIVSDVCVTPTAPILSWALWRNAGYLRDYFKRQGWKATRVSLKD